MFEGFAPTSQTAAPLAGRSRSFRRLPSAYSHGLTYAAAPRRQLLGAPQPWPGSHRMETATAGREAKRRTDVGPALCSLLLRFLDCRHQCRNVESGYVMGDAAWSAAFQIGEDDHRELVVDITGEVGGESLPGSSMLNEAMATDVVDEPGKAIVVRVWFAVAQLHWRPHFLQARWLEEFVGVQGGVP